VRVVTTDIPPVIKDGTRVCCSDNAGELYRVDVPTRVRCGGRARILKGQVDLMNGPMVAGSYESNHFSAVREQVSVWKEGYG